MTESRASPPPGRFVRLVDKLFPLVWVALYALLPVSGSSERFLRTSFDQSRDLEALRSVLENGSAAAIADNLIGPAYIATAALIHWVTGLTPGDALTTLTRISYVLSVAGCLVLVRVLVRRLASDSPAVSLPAQLSFVVLVFVAGTWHWSDIPWSHFYAAFLAVAFYVLRLLPTRPALAVSALLGVVLALLALTRSFELMAVLTGWGLAAGLFAVLRIRGTTLWRPSGVAVGTAAFLTTTAAVYAATGKRNAFLLYGSDRGEEYGDLRPEEIASIPTLDLALIPVKLAQLFLDPCIYSLCELTEYVGGGTDVWKQPLTIQLPALVVLPLCILALAVLVVRAAAAKRGERAAGRARELRLLVELTAVASGLTFGYIASSWSSSTALGYGFARDFMLPFLLAGVVSVALAFSALDHVLSRRESIRLPAGARLSQGAAYWAVAMLGTVALVTATLMARTWGLPRLENRHLAALEYDVTCAGARCTVEVVAANPRGRKVDVPGASLLTVGCGGEEPRFTVHVEKPSRGFPVPPTCRDPRLVAAWPMTMGVPPNSDVLRTIQVANSIAR